MGSKVPKLYSRSCVTNRLIAVLLAILATAAIFPLIASADDYVGGIPLTTVQTGTVSGDLWYDISPAPDWGSYNVTKTFTLPAAAVAEPGRIKWARLYISGYCGHMQNDYPISFTNRWDGDGVSGYEHVWTELKHEGFNYLIDPDTFEPLGNDNSEFPGHGANEPYLMLNDHETRVTSDYFMYYDVTSMIGSQTVNVNVNTVTPGQIDGRIKVISLIVAYDDGDDDRITYWVNEGHDVCSYYTENSYGYVAVGSTAFHASGLPPVSNATLAIDYMASNSGYYGFPSGDNDFNVSTMSGSFAYSLDRTADVQGPYSGVIEWNVTGLIDGNGDVSLSYARYLPAIGTSAFYKLPIAILKVTLEPPPEADFSANASSGTAPLSVQFTDNSSGNITSRAWDFDGDGIADSSQASPEHVYAMPGNYTAKLTVTGPAGSDSASCNITVRAPPAPVANFSCNATSGYVPLTAQFTDASSNSPTGWEWDFDGDGVVDSREQNPIHTYGSPGTFTVTLNASNVGGSGLVTKSGLVTAILPSPPAAAFSAAPLDGIMPLSVAFSDGSSNVPSAWLWDFGDGNSSTEQSPVHTYFSPGCYTVSLAASNAGGNGTETKDDYIRVRHKAPVASFSSDVQVGLSPLSVAFSDGSSNVPSAWLWDFGDGNSSTEQSPVHTYFSPGCYTVSLAASNAGGNGTETKDDYIRVRHKAPVASFSSDVQVGLSPLSVAFSDGSSNVPSAWLWDFGDGNSSTEQSPVHTYFSPGCYTVSLAASNDGGSNTTARTGYITVTDRPVLHIAPAATTATPGDKAVFDVIAGSLPDGLSRFRVNVTLDVPGVAGIDSVLYPAWADGSTDIVNDTACIEAGDPGDNVTAGQAGVKLATITLSSLSAGTVAILLEDPVLDDDSGGSCTPVAVNGSLSVYVPLEASINASPEGGAVPLEIALYGQSSGTPGPDSWLWDFGDGGTSGERNSTHNYTAPGKYRVNLTIENGYCQSMASIIVNVTSPRPQANFTWDSARGPAPLTVTFTDLSSGDIDHWDWSFGDGNTSSEQNPTHTYETPNGVNPPYTVALTVGNDGGNDTMTAAGLIKVDYPPPVADFYGSPVSGDLPLTVQFVDRSSHATSWYWEFGDGNTSSDRNATYTYVSRGNYTVRLTVTGSGGSANLTRAGYVKAGAQADCDLSIAGKVSTIGGVVFAKETNAVYVIRINNSGPSQSPQTEVEVTSSDGFEGRATVPALEAAHNTTVTIVDTLIRPQAGATVTYTAVIDPDDAVVETDEDNNQKTGDAETVVYNGYKGKRYWTGETDDTTALTYDLRGGIVHSFGDSVYTSGSFQENNKGWNSYTVDWKAADLKIPANATVVEARLYVPYTWDNANVAPGHVHVSFNGIDVSYEHWYHDVSNFGAYYDHVYGLLTYDVTAQYNKNAENKAVFSREGNPDTTKISPYGFTLAVVYEDANSTRKQIFLNEEFDLLGASPESYGTTTDEATAYVPFSGMAIDTANVSHAYLITFVPSGAAQDSSHSGEGNLLFNGNTIATYVWDYGLVTGPQVAVNVRDVTPYLLSTGNVAGIQSTAGKTPCMAAAQEFLVVEYVTPGATANETLNETLAGTQGSDEAPVLEASSSGPGADPAAGRGAVTSAVQENGISPTTAIASLVLVVVFAGAFGAVIYFIINGTVLPSRVALTGAIAIVVLVAAAGGFVAGQSANGTGAGDNATPSAAAAVTAHASFSVIPTVQGIEDEDTSDQAPDYPAGFQADNGILFVHAKGDPVKVGDVSIRLESGGESVAIGPSDSMPSDRCTSDKVIGYIGEPGGGDGVVRQGEWLMLYADGCFDGPGGRAVTWNAGGKQFVVHEGDRVAYTIMDASGGVIQEGSFLFNP